MGAKVKNVFGFRSGSFQADVELRQAFEKEDQWDEDRHEKIMNEPEKSGCSE